MIRLLNAGMLLTFIMCMAWWIVFAIEHFIQLLTAGS